VCNSTTGLHGSGSSNAGLVSIGFSNSSLISSSNISSTLFLESLLCGNDITGYLFTWDEGNIGWTKWARLLGIHGVELGISHSLEWSSSSVHHVDSRGGIVPFFGVGSGNIIGVIFSNHSVVLLLEFLLGGSSSSGGISSLLPGSS
jgi:hypothetical protein